MLTRLKLTSIVILIEMRHSDLTKKLFPLYFFKGLVDTRDSTVSEAGKSTIVFFSLNCLFGYTIIIDTGKIWTWESEKPCNLRELESYRKIRPKYIEISQAQAESLISKRDICKFKLAIKISKKRN